MAPFDLLMTSGADVSILKIYSLLPVYEVMAKPYPTDAYHSIFVSACPFKFIMNIVYLPAADYPEKLSWQQEYFNDRIIEPIKRKNGEKKACEDRAWNTCVKPCPGSENSTM